MVSTDPVITSAVASAALTSPYWLPALEGVSSVAALLLPILGALWLLVQILFKVAKRRDKREG